MHRTLDKCIAIFCFQNFDALTYHKNHKIINTAERGNWNGFQHVYYHYFNFVKKILKFFEPILKIGAKYTSKNNKNGPTVYFFSTVKKR